MSYTVIRVFTFTCDRKDCDSSCEIRGDEYFDAVRQLKALGWKSLAHVRHECTDH